MLVIRPAEASDVLLILQLIHELATYEREPHAVVATEADLLRDGFGEHPFFHCLIAEVEGVAGWLCDFTSSTTRPGGGGQGFIWKTCSCGRRFAGGVSARLSSLRSPKLQWRTNARVSSGTCSTGTRRRLISIIRWVRMFMSEWRIMRVSGDALTALAAGQPIPAQPASATLER